MTSKAKARAQPNHLFSRDKQLKAARTLRETWLGTHAQCWWRLCHSEASHEPRMQHRGSSGGDAWNGERTDETRKHTMRPGEMKCRENSTPVSNGESEREMGEKRDEWVQQLIQTTVIKDSHRQDDENRQSSITIIVTEPAHTHTQRRRLPLLLTKQSVCACVSHIAWRKIGNKQKTKFIFIYSYLHL